ncbi:MAG: hemolysin family protein [Chloroflexota bacterium]|nr:hemolysin family protein [Dehalococcoidia bacterium]MDW8255212.1 hemolysin family protein [Chloroflexota bacterium]
METVLQLLAVAALVFANGFFVASEFALVSVRRSRIEQLVAEGVGSAKVVQRTLHRLDGAIAATQLGITMASIALGWIGEAAVAHLLEPLFAFLPGILPVVSAHALAVAVAFATITALHIILGELAPKTLALQRSEQVALTIARPLELFYLVFRPAIAVLNGAGNWVVRRLGLRPASGHELVHSVEELEILIESSKRAGVLDEEEAQLLGRVFDFSERPAHRIMTPRTEIIAVPDTATLPQLLAVAREQNVSRVPVYHGTIDNIIGMVLLKDLLRALPEVSNGSAPSFDIQQVMRPVLLVPETISIDELLKRMREQKLHLAILLDEFGGTAGLVTMEDIIEEIFGEIRDESDVDETEEEIIATENGALIDGHTDIQDVNERFGLTLDDSEYDTIGGYVFGALGRAPRVGDRIDVDGYRFEVVAVEGMRISRLRLTRLEGDAASKTAGQPSP